MVLKVKMSSDLDDPRLKESLKESFVRLVCLSIKCLSSITSASNFFICSIVTVSTSSLLTFFLSSTELETLRNETLISNEIENWLHYLSGGNIRRRSSNFSFILLLLFRSLFCTISLLFIFFCVGSNFE